MSTTSRFPLALIMALAFISQSSFAQVEEYQETLDKIRKVHRSKFLKAQTNNKLKVQEVFLVGKIRNQEIQIAHFNDEDLLGSATDWGYPVDDDRGRTSGAVLDYLLEDEHGSLDISLESWLFAKQPELTNDEDEQYVTDHLAISARRRLVTNNQGEQYIILGFKVENETETPRLMAYLQNLIHSINSRSSLRKNLAGDSEKLWATALGGVGKKFKIIDKEYVKFSVQPEVELQISSRIRSESEVRFSVDADLEMNLFNIMQVELGGNSAFSRTFNGENNDERSGFITFGSYFGTNVQSNLGIQVSQFNYELDRQYEGGRTTNMSLFLKFRY